MWEKRPENSGLFNFKKGLAKLLISLRNSKKSQKKAIQMSFFKQFIWGLFLTGFLVFSGCKKQPEVINLEQAHNPKSAHIMAPGLGTIGIIEDDQLFVYYLNESHRWILDKVSQFEIPENSSGMLALGMGFLGVLQERVMHFYFLDAENQWARDDEVMFVLPQNYKRISTMRMPWDVGQIVLEESEGLLGFYYIDESGRWLRDETAGFILPAGIDDYLMLGAMEIGIIRDNKLGVFRLNDEGEWLLDDDTVLTLPSDTQAVLSFEPGTIAVLNSENTLNFYDHDPMSGKWLFDATMNFTIPEQN